MAAASLAQKLRDMRPAKGQSLHELYCQVADALDAAVAALNGADDLLRRCNPDLLRADEQPATDDEWDAAHEAIRAAISKATGATTS